MKTSIDYGFMLVFLACLFAFCACEEAKDEKLLLRGGALSAIEKTLPNSVQAAKGSAVKREMHVCSCDDEENKVSEISQNIKSKEDEIASLAWPRDIQTATKLFNEKSTAFDEAYENYFTDCVIVGNHNVTHCTTLQTAMNWAFGKKIQAQLLLNVVQTKFNELATLRAELKTAQDALKCCIKSCKCDPEPKGCDDPHLWTWKGTRYNYHGQCDLIYTTCPKFDNNKGLHLHLRTEFVLPRKWSTISSIALQIGDDVLEVQNNGTYFLNMENFDVDLTDDETKLLSGHKLSHRTAVQPNITSSIFTVNLGDDVSLEVTRKVIYGRNSISFKISGVYQHRMNGGDSFADCVGLSSTWDHPEDAEFLIGRSGKAYRPREAIDFGPEWQVDLTKEDPMLFVENIGQQLPDQECLDSPLQAKDQRHLKALHAAEGGALARQAEEACGHLNEGGDLFEACFFDVLVTGDVTFALEPWYNEGE